MLKATRIVSRTVQEHVYLKLEEESGKTEHHRLNNNAKKSQMQLSCL